MTKYGKKISSRKQPKDAMFYIRHMFRIFIGVLFIFSGYTKMVDPYGTALKMEEYFHSFGLDFMSPIAMAFAILLNCAEFLLGWALLLGIQMQITAWGLMLFMSFFTLLTFWLAYALDIVTLINRLFGTAFEIEVVSDCGCFGDFIKLDNYQTFYKNVIFMLCTSLIFAQRNKYKQQFWYYLSQWFPILLVLGFTFFMQFHCLRHEPWHDFRPWKIGNFIAGETYSKAPEVDHLFLYKHKIDGTILELTMDDLSEISADSLRLKDWEDNYAYFDRKDTTTKEGINARLADFSMTDWEQQQDIKSMVIPSPEYTFIVFIRDVTEVTPERFASTKKLIEACDVEGMNYYVVTGSLQTEADTFNIIYNTNIQFYYSDITPLKTAIRNNPGVILLKDGYVMDKWAYRDIPLLEEIKADIPDYEQRLIKYKKKNPPIFPGEEKKETLKTNTNSRVPVSESREDTIRQ